MVHSYSLWYRGRALLGCSFLKLGPASLLALSRIWVLWKISCLGFGFTASETPQESIKDEVSQPGIFLQEEFLDWLTSGRGSQHHPPISGEGRVGVTYYDSLYLLIGSVYNFTQPQCGFIRNLTCGNSFSSFLSVCPTHSYPWLDFIL